jgi:DNA polymerase III, gamma/tau subunits
MNAESSNKLLKSIEEPGDNTYFILISQNRLKIIPTILSRCRIIEIPPIDSNTLADELVKLKGIGEKEAQFIAKYSGGSYGNAINITQSLEKSNENFNIFISILNSALSKDLVKLIELGEQLAGLGRETQKKFCIDALEIIRKLYVFSLGVDDISYIPDDKLIIYKDISQKIKRIFIKDAIHY